MNPGDTLNALRGLKLDSTGFTGLPMDDLIGSPLLLFFYPKDNTPGCTNECRDFAALHDRFAALGVRVLGVSRDSLASHERFRAKLELPFDLVSDSDERLCRSFDVLKEKNMYGRKVFGIERSSFLFDADGVLVQSWRKLKVPGHAEAVLDAARTLA